MVRKQSGQTPKRTVGEKCTCQEQHPVFLEYPSGQHRPQGATILELCHGLQLIQFYNMADLLSFLPPFDGLLPKWLFLVRAVRPRGTHQAKNLLTDMIRSPWSQQQTASKPIAPTHTPPSSTTPEPPTIDPPPTLSPPAHSAPGPSSRRLSAGMPPTTSRRRQYMIWLHGLLALP